MAFSLAGALDQTTEWIKESVHEELLSLSEATLTPGAENNSKPSLSPTLVLNISLRSAQAHPAFSVQMGMPGTTFSLESPYFALWSPDKTSYIDALT